MSLVLWEGHEERAKAKKLFTFIRSKQSKEKSWPYSFALNAAIREICYLSCRNELRVIAERTFLGLPTTFINILRANPATLEEFEEEFERYLTAAKQKADSPWVFYLPFYMEQKQDTHKLPQARILGIDFEFMDYSAVLKQLPGKQFEKLASTENFAGLTQEVKPPQIYISVKNEGISWRAAWEEVEPAFDTLRGIVECILGQGTLHYDSHQQPRSKVPHPAWLAAYFPGNEIAFESVDSLVDPYRKGKLLEFNKEFIADLATSSRLFELVPPEESTTNLVARCLRLYVQALDSRFLHHCLVGLWQLAELLTLVDDSNGQTKVVINRLGWHTSSLCTKGVELDRTLRAIAKKRNEIVHSGINKVSDEDVNFMKIVCEQAVEWLLDKRESLPTVQHVREFYRLRTTNGTDLEKAISAGGVAGQVAQFVKGQSSK